MQFFPLFSVSDPKLKVFFGSGSNFLTESNEEMFRNNLKVFRIESVFTKKNCNYINIVFTYWQIVTFST